MNNTPPKHNRIALWTGWILSILCVLFLLVDAIMKIVRAQVSVDGTVGLGFSDAIVQPMGIWLLVFTILYSIPGTALPGALLLTAHLGGAVAIFVQRFHGSVAFLFPLAFCILVWLGLWLRDHKLRTVMLAARQAPAEGRS